MPIDDASASTTVRPVITKRRQCRVQHLARFQSRHECRFNFVRSEIVFRDVSCVPPRR